MIRKKLQSHTEDQPTAPRGRVTEYLIEVSYKIKELKVLNFSNRNMLSENVCYVCTFIYVFTAANYSFEMY